MRMALRRPVDADLADRTALRVTRAPTTLSVRRAERRAGPPYGYDHASSIGGTGGAADQAASLRGSGMLRETLRMMILHRWNMATA